VVGGAARRVEIIERLLIAGLESQGSVTL
jgi:hypothetical protein